MNPWKLTWFIHPMVRNEQHDATIPGPFDATLCAKVDVCPGLSHLTASRRVERRNVVPTMNRISACCSCVLLISASASVQTQVSLRATRK